MIRFFDPAHAAQEVFPMYELGHFILIAVMILLIPLMVWQKDRLAKLRRNRSFMVALSWFIIGGEIVGYILKFVYGFQPMYERFPFHLCGSMALLIPTLVLLNRFDIVRFFAGWSVACGVISFLNLGMTYQGPDTFYFYHYLWKHYYLFAFPIFLFITGEFEFNYRDWAKSMAALIVYSGLIFLVNWALDTNYLYIGPNNELAVPFLPDSFLDWPAIWPSFIGVGLVLFHIIFAGFALAQWRRRHGNPRRVAS